MNHNIKAEIDAAVEGLRDEMIETLAGLVRIPSVVGNEGPAQNFMQRQYEGLGLDVQAFEADKNKVGRHSAYVESGLPFEGRPNIIGVLKGDPAKKSMILNGQSARSTPATGCRPWPALPKWPAGFRLFRAKAWLKPNRLQSISMPPASF